MREIFEEKIYVRQDSQFQDKGSRDQTTLIDRPQAFADNVSTSQQTTTKYRKRNWLWIQETNIINYKKKRPMGHIAHSRNLFILINTFVQSYAYIITLIWRGENQ